MSIVAAQPDIDWHTDTETIPDDCKDGREIVLWAGSLVVSIYDGCWRDPVGREVKGWTHWADVRGPGL